MTETKRLGLRDRDTERQRHRDTDTDRETETERKRQSERDRGKETGRCGWLVDAFVWKARKVPIRSYADPPR